jgi:prepilin-type N-terminal cleavage/methylation domain-containing protein
MTAQKHSPAIAGFTMIEVLVAISVAGILMAIAIPRFYAVLPGIRLTLATRQVATDLQLARMRAIAQRTNKTIVFTPPNLYSFDVDTRNLSLLFPGTTVAVAPGDPTFTTMGSNAGATTIIRLTNNGVCRTVTVNVAGRIITGNVC